MATPTTIAAYLALFTAIGFIFIFVNLLVGRFVRPNAPNEEKLEIYECGEPTIGSSFVQFDIRFYVVALLFIIFDVEVAFFFPWASVYGKSTEMLDPEYPIVASQLSDIEPSNLPTDQLNAKAAEFGLTANQLTDSGEVTIEPIREMANTLSLISMADIAVFFAVLLVGFAYVWKRGDLDWVRTVPSESSSSDSTGPTTAGKASDNQPAEQQVVLSV